MCRIEEFEKFAFFGLSLPTTLGPGGARGKVNTCNFTTYVSLIIDMLQPKQVTVRIVIF